MPLFKSFRSRNRKSDLSDVGSVASRQSTSSNNNETSPANAAEAKTDFGPSSYKNPFMSRKTSKSSTGPPAVAAAAGGMVSPSSDSTPVSPGAIERSKSRSFFGGNQPRRQSSSASNRTRPVFGRKGSSTQATGLPAIERVTSPRTEELDPLAAEAVAAAAAAAQPPPGSRPSDLFGKGMAWGEVDPSGGPTKTPQQTEDLQKFLRERRQWVPTFVTEETPEIDVKPVEKPNDIAFSSTLPQSASLMSIQDLEESHHRKQLLLDESFPAAEHWNAVGGSSAGSVPSRSVTSGLPTTSDSTSTITGPTISIPQASVKATNAAEGNHKLAPLTLHPSSGGVDPESPTTPRKSTTIARKPVPSADTSLPSTPAAPRRSSEIPVYPTSPQRSVSNSNNGALASPAVNGKQDAKTNGSTPAMPQEAASKSIPSPALSTPGGPAGILPMAPSPALPSSNADTPDPSARTVNDESAQPFEVPSTASTNTIHADSLAGAAPSPMTGEPGGDSTSRGPPSVIASVAESGAGQNFETPDASLPASEAGHGGYRGDEHESRAALPLSSSSHGLGRLVNDDNGEEGTAPRSAEPSESQRTLADESKEELVEANLSPQEAGKAGGIPPHLLRTQSQMTPLAMGADEGSPFPGGMAASAQS